MNGHTVPYGFSGVYIPRAAHSMISADISLSLSELSCATRFCNNLESERARVPKKEVQRGFPIFPLHASVTFVSPVY